MANYKRYKNIIFFVISVISLVLLISFIHPTFNLDEEYTMGLISHNYKKVFLINMLDVHPPTYYFLLKTFLNITTFWTNSLYIKILFGHILSLMAFVLSFLILHNIVKGMHIDVNWILQLIVYLLFYSISLYAIDLRMHGFSALFNILTFNELLKFDKSDNKIRYLVFSLLFAIVSAYMDYFSAVCVGSLLIIFCVRYFILHKTLKAFKIFWMGNILLIFFVPLMLLMLKQIVIRQKFISNSAPTLENFSDICNSFTQSKYGIIIIIPFTITIIWSFKHLNNNFNNILKIILLSYLLSLFVAIIVCIKIKVFEPKFLYPLFSIYSFLVSTIFILILKYYRTSVYRCIFILLLSVIPMMSIVKSYMNIKEYSLPSIQLIHNMNHYRGIASHNIYINYKKVPSYVKSSPKQVYITQTSVYLQSFHKKLIVVHCTPKIASQIVNGNSSLLKKTFTNLQFKN